MLTLIWQCNRDTAWESDWIEWLFKDIPHQTIADEQHMATISHSILVRSGPVTNSGYFKHLKEKIGSFGLIHLSDESGTNPIEHYTFADFILRNYYKDLGSHVLNFPLGWIKTYPSDLRPQTIFGRRHTWAFTGHIDKTTRISMAQNMLKVAHGRYFFKRYGQDFGSFHGYVLTPIEMAYLYHDAIFVPCPQGYSSTDTFRVSEALQVGCIPIVESSHYWQHLYGDNPLLQIDSWEQAPALINSLMKDADALEMLRERTYTWWNHYCNTLTQKIRDLLIKNGYC